MEISVRTNEVKLARMQECLSVLQKKGIGFAGKYIDHETYRTKHAHGHTFSYFSTYLEHDPKDKLERIEIERDIANDFEAISLGIAKTANSKEMQQLQTMVFSAIEVCIIKGHLKEAEKLVKHIADGEYENSRNRIGLRDTVVRHYLKGIIKGYAKMTRQTIKRPDEIVSLSGNLEQPASLRENEILYNKKQELFAQWQKKHPETRSVLSEKELSDIENGKKLSDITIERIEFDNNLKQVIANHTPFCNQAQKLMDDIFAGKFGSDLRGDEFFYIDLAQIFNHHIASSCPQKEPYRWGGLSKANEQIRDYARKQTVKATPPTMQKPSSFCK